MLIVILNKIGLFPFFFFFFSFFRSPKNPKQKIIKRVIALEGDFIKSVYSLSYILYCFGGDIIDIL